MALSPECAEALVDMLTSYAQLMGEVGTELRPTQDVARVEELGGRVRDAAARYRAAPVEDDRA